MKAVVSKNGQVTIPKALRTRLRIRPGAVLDFAEEDGRLVARQELIAEDPVDAAWGILALDESADEFIRHIRGR